MVFLRKVKRTIFSNKVQYFCAFFMIILSVMLFVGMGIVADNMSGIFNDFTTGNVLGDAEFYVNTDLNIDEFESKFNAKLEKSGVLDYELTPGQTLRIFSENTKVSIPAVLEGRPLNGSDILIDSLFADANALHIGDSVEINGKNYQIAGFMTLPNYIYIIKDLESMVNDSKAFGIAVMGKDDWESVQGGQVFYSIKFNSAENISNQELAVKTYLNETNVTINSWKSMADNVKVTYVFTEITMITTMGRVVPIVLMILTCILIAILMRRLISRESVIIGTLYALGYRKKEIRKHYLTFPLIIGLAGGVLGLLFGLLIINPILGYMITFFTMPFNGVIYTYTGMVIGILTPVIVLCVCSILVVNKTLRSTPVVLMKGGNIKDKKNFIERRIRLDRFSFNTKFQIREQARSISRFAFLLFGVIAATMMLLFGLTLKSSLDGMLSDGFQSLYNLKYEYVYNEQHTEPLPADIEPFGFIYASIDTKDTEISVFVAGILPDTTRILLKDSAGKKVSANQVVMTSLLAKKLKVKAGDEISMIGNEDLKPYTLKIDAIAQSNAGEFIFMPLADFNAMVNLPADSYSGIWLDTQMSFPAGEIRSSKSTEAIVESMNNMIGQISPMVYSLTVSACVLGLLIIFIVTGLVVDENKNTISLMKIFGYKKRQIGRLILNSSTPVVIIGYLIGVPLILASITALLNLVTGSMQLTIPVELNVLYILFGFAVILLTYQLAKAMSRKKVNHIPMSEALKAGTE